MKIKYKEFITDDIITALHAFLNEKIPLKTSIILADLADDIDSHIKTYREQTQLLLNRHVQTNDNGSFKMVDPKNPNLGYLLKPESKEQYHKEMKELNETEIKLNYRKIKDSDLPKDLNIAPNTLRKIKFLFN